MKLSRQSSGCQRNPSISRMTRCVYLVQSLNRSRPFLDMGMTPSHQRSSPGRLPANLTVLVLEGGGDRAAPPWPSLPRACSPAYFEDEYAYIAQSYYADLFFAGRFNDLCLARIPRIRLATLAQVSDRVVVSIGSAPDAQACRGMRAIGTTTTGHFGTLSDAVGRSRCHRRCGALGCRGDFCMWHSAQGLASRCSRRCYC